MKDLVHAYLDDELSLTEQVTFEQHLATCPECEAAHRSFARLRESLHSESLRFEMPPNVRRMAHFPKTNRRVSLFLRSVGVAAMLLIVLSSFMILLTRTSEQKLAQELVDAHVRSLQADHLLDVVSTDQHTVKPWFDGKIDFAPPVRDLKEQGFPLVGGRLDYLHNHAVAAVVYQRNKHQINLFIWPEAGGDERVRESALNGYQMLVWKQSGMREVAVSDLNVTELKQFAQLLH